MALATPLQHSCNQSVFLVFSVEQYFFSMMRTVWQDNARPSPMESTFSFVCALMFNCINREPSGRMGGYCTGLRQVGFKVCVECLIGKQKKPILRVFKVTEPSSVRTAPPVPAKMCLVLKWLRVKGLGVCTVGGVCV